MSDAASRNTNNVKLILCDLGNVLIRFDHRIAVRKILEFTPKSFDEVYSVFFDSALTRSFEEGKVSPPDFFKALQRELGLSRITYAQFVPLWNDIFFPNPGMEAVLEDLKKRYHLHMISNVNMLHYEYLLKIYPHIFSYFDKVILSFVSGCCKPDIRIYKEAVQGCGYSFRETLYTDDRSDLIAEATKLGIPSLQFTGVEDFKKELNHRALL